VFWAVVISVLGIDQIAKAAVRARFAPGETTDFIPGVLNLTYVRNVGAAFGLLPGRQPLFVLTSLVVLLVIGAYWRRSRPKLAPVVIALGLVCGGAVGNFIDRVWLGKVTDFFEFAFFDFPVFNVADSAIVIGVGILIAWLLFTPDPAHADEDAS
jgi:signal peptidase II